MSASFAPRRRVLRALALAGLVGVSAVLYLPNSPTTPVPDRTSASAGEAVVPSAPATDAPKPQLAAQAEAELRERQLKAARLELVVRALGELADTVSFFEQCGVANKGFTACEREFAPDDLELRESFAFKSAAADDGFVLTLSVRGAPPAGECALYRYDSAQGLTAFDAAGSRSDACLSPEGLAAQQHGDETDLTGPLQAAALPEAAASAEVQSEVQAVPREWQMQL